MPVGRRREVNRKLKVFYFYGGGGGGALMNSNGREMFSGIK